MAALTEEQVLARGKIRCCFATMPGRYSFGCTLPYGHIQEHRAELHGGSDWVSWAQES